ncbi:hypothetical protein HDU67_008914 [Dinochytrium kinnereticum]|nr:hypothetical protein HDU67_008914 [Dinochytrium kinnereticum]
MKTINDELFIRFSTHHDLINPLKETHRRFSIQIDEYLAILSPSSGRSPDQQLLEKRQQRDIERKGLLDGSSGATAIIFNLFCLESWSIAEKMGIPCLAASTFLASLWPVPLGFENMLREEFPELYEQIERAAQSDLDLTVGDIRHWCWRMFLDDIGNFRETALGLDAMPFSDVVLNRKARPRATPLLYGLFPGMFASLSNDFCSPMPNAVKFTGYWSLDDPSLPACKLSDHPLEAKLSGTKGNPAFILIAFGSMTEMMEVFVNMNQARRCVESLQEGLQDIRINDRAVSAIWLIPQNSVLSLIANEMGNNASTRLIFAEVDTGTRQLNRMIPSCNGHWLNHYTHRDPFSSLLPSAAAVMHHGGIGTVVSCLKQGVHHIVSPFMFDQQDWGSWLETRDLGRTILADRRIGGWDVRHLREAFRWAVESDGVETRVWAERLERSSREEWAGLDYAAKFAVSHIQADGVSVGSKQVID